MEIITSLEQKPEKNGIPTMEKQPIYVKIYVTGNLEYKPPIFLISLLQFKERIIEPNDKNNKALKKAKLKK